jgi:dTDP-4-dehydrorhamnose reductase
MLGHQIVRELGEAGHYVVAVARRTEISAHVRDCFFGHCDLRTGVDIADIDTVRQIVSEARPDWIVNAAGLIKQRSGTETEFAKVNADFPHQLAFLAEKAAARIVQISTDCVFSGLRGGYSTSDAVDPVDAYGFSKLAGELGSPNITIRTSIVGREIYGGFGLLEWFLAQKGTVAGHENAFFTGISTLVFARAIERTVSCDLESGLYHLPGPRIDKASLLRLFCEAFEVDLAIQPSPTPRVDRSLLGEWPAPLLGPPNWPTMIAELASLSGAYDRVRMHEYQLNEYQLNEYQHGESAS